MKPIDFHDLASAEVDEAAAQYEQRCPGLGRDFVLEVQRVAALIEQNPLRGAKYKRTLFRYRLLQRFPFVMYYKEMHDRIWIVAVAHAKRRPGYWRHRQVEH